MAECRAPTCTNKVKLGGENCRGHEIVRYRDRGVRDEDIRRWMRLELAELDALVEAVSDGE